MTKAELIAFAAKKYGPLWIAPMAEETGYSFSGLWRVTKREGDIPKRLEREVVRIRRQHTQNAKVKP